MKKIILFLIVSLFAGRSKAQHVANFEFSAGPVAVIPIGTFADNYSVAFGGTFQGVLNLHPHNHMSEWQTDTTSMGVVAEAGYEYFGGKDITFGTQTYNVDGFGLIPVTAGIRWVFIPHLYISGQAGVAISTASGGNTDFHYLLGLGYGFHFPVNVDVRYAGYSDNGNSSGGVDIRFAYRFR